MCYYCLRTFTAWSKARYKTVAFLKTGFGTDAHAVVQPLALGGGAAVQEHRKSGTTVRGVGGNSQRSRLSSAHRKRHDWRVRRTWSWIPLVLSGSASQPAGGAAASRGRPRQDTGQRVSKLLSDFSEVSRDNPRFFGAGRKARQKALMRLGEDISKQ